MDLLCCYDKMSSLSGSSKSSFDTLPCKTSFESLSGVIPKSSTKAAVAPKQQEYVHKFEDSYFQFAKKFNQYKEESSPPPPQHGVNNRYSNGPGKNYPEVGFPQKSYLQYSNHC